MNIHIKCIVYAFNSMQINLNYCAILTCSLYFFSTHGFKDLLSKSSQKSVLCMACKGVSLNLNHYYITGCKLQNQSIFQLQCYTYFQILKMQKKIYPVLQVIFQVKKGESIQS